MHAGGDGWAAVQHLPDAVWCQRARRQCEPAAGLHHFLHLLLCLRGGDLLEATPRHCSTEARRN